MDSMRCEIFQPRFFLNRAFVRVCVRVCVCVCVPFDRGTWGTSEISITGLVINRVKKNIKKLGDEATLHPPSKTSSLPQKSFPHPSKKKSEKEKKRRHWSSPDINHLTFPWNFGALGTERFLKVPLQEAVFLQMFQKLRATCFSRNV